MSPRMLGVAVRIALVGALLTVGLPGAAVAAVAKQSPATTSQAKSKASTTTASKAKSKARSKAKKSFGAVFNLGKKSEKKKPTLAERRARVDRYRVSQADREAAAARMKLQQAIAGLSAGMTANRFAAQAAVLTTPTQGGVPDYFGPWANWAYSPPIRKFVDDLPLLGPAGANNLGNFIPVAYPDTVTYPGCDYYEIELREYEQKLHSDLPPTRLRGYVQVNKGTDEFGNNTIEPDPIHYLGPTIFARKDRPVRVKFTNKLPVGEGGDLFIPVDTSVMGAGKGPTGEMYTQNRATLHLHGGKTVWISDGTPHQWITPADENTPYPKGVSVKNVPDMPDPGPGSMTFFYSNQQSARMLWYHDHSYGITRLNVYAGEAAAYMLTDETEQELIAKGVIPEEQIPLIIQDKTFVDADTILDTDPTWNWGTGPKDPDTGIRTPKTGDLWVPHVYVPAQNPADLSGMNATGRWHYGPWFWPPVTNIRQGPIPNPYYDPVNAPWEPPLMPATPNPSMGMEHYNDTPLINGTPYPKLTVEPKAYRFRILNAANDRFFNLSLFEADPTVESVDGRRNTEVKMVPAVPNPAYPERWPTDGREGGVPDPATAGPDWIQIGTEGGFLPKPAIIPPTPVGWNNDATTFNAGNVNSYSLMLGCAERADVIVDFSQYAGKTLILYNDAPTAFPALDPRTDYYTGMPDMTDTGGHWGTDVGFGPNTRTIMQITVATSTPAPPFDVAALEAEFASTETTPGVFAKSQNPIIVPDSRYDSAYNKAFPREQYVRIYESSKTFRDLDGNVVTKQMEPKAIQDEAGETWDPEYGRMAAKLGLERIGTNAANQNFITYGFIDPSTENLVDNMTPLSPVSADGTQIWKITHNGVDTHPVHFHLFDVQLINHVAWDGGIRPPDDNELGWKDTVRVDPLEDTIVALKPVAPKMPFGVPDSVRPLNPAEPIGSTMDFANIDPITGQAINPPITNQMVNFGWEYVWHCHILSHEEMDMMRPMTVAVGRALSDPPVIAGIGQTGSPVTISWTDPTPADDPATLGNPKNEIGFRVERAPVVGGATGAFTAIGTALANQESYVDTTTVTGETYRYRVVAFNAAGETYSNLVTGGPSGFMNRYEQDDANLSFQGVWPTASVPDLSGGSYSYTQDGAVNVAFNGTGIDWVTVKMNVNGIARVSLDGGPWQDVDLYSPTYEPQSVVYSVSGLTDGPHTLRIEPTGTKNPASADTYVGVDAFDVAGTLTMAYPRRFEQNSSLLYKTGPWFTSNAFGLSSGSYTYTDSGAMDVAFNGTGIDWVTVKMNVNGIARVSLDGGPWQDVDLYSPTYEPQSVVYSVSGLTDGPHTLRIEPTGTKNPASDGLYVGVDAFDVTGTLTQAGPNRYEQDDPNLAFTGTWNVANEAALSAGTYAYTGDGSVTAKFNGTGVSWITVKMPVNGIATVVVDGGAPQLVDLYSPTYEPQSTVFTATGLADGTHTITITFTGTKNAASSDFWVGVDAFDVFGTLVPAP